MISSSNERLPPAKFEDASRAEILQQADYPVIPQECVAVQVDRIGEPAAREPVGPRLRLAQCLSFV